MIVFPAFLVVKIDGALMVYKSLRAKGSWAFFLPPFLPFVNLLFLPMIVDILNNDDLGNRVSIQTSVKK